MNVLSDKDVFMKNYQKFLGNRLINNKVVSFETEEMFLKEFSKNEGETFTDSCRTMI